MFPAYEPAQSVQTVLYRAKRQGEIGAARNCSRARLGIIERAIDRPVIAAGATAPAVGMPPAADKGAVNRRGLSTRPCGTPLVCFTVAARPRLDRRLPPPPHPPIRPARTPFGNEEPLKLFNGIQALAGVRAAKHESGSGIWPSFLSSRPTYEQIPASLLEQRHERRSAWARCVLTVNYFEPRSPR